MNQTNSNSCYRLLRDGRLKVKQTKNEPLKFTMYAYQSNAMKSNGQLSKLLLRRLKLITISLLNPN